MAEPFWCTHADCLESLEQYKTDEALAHHKIKHANAKEWTCHKCSFANSPKTRLCIMCFQPKQKEAKEPEHGQLLRTPPQQTARIGGGCRSSFITKNEILKKTFDKFDFDKSGSIDARELKVLFDDLKWDSDEESIRRCLDFLDKDINGQICFDEFSRFTEYAWQNKVLSGASLEYINVPDYSGRGRLIIPEFHGQDRPRSRSASRSSLGSLEEEPAHVDRAKAETGRLQNLPKSHAPRTPPTTSSYSPHTSPRHSFSSPTEAKHEILRSAFDNFDYDASGTINDRELKALFRELKWNDDDESVESCLKFLDKDHSSEIDFEEFTRFYEYAWKNKILGGDDFSVTAANMRRPTGTATGALGGAGALAKVLTVPGDARGRSRSRSTSRSLAAVTEDGGFADDSSLGLSSLAAPKLGGPKGIIEQKSFS